MGLRIGQTQGILSALRNLGQNLQSLARTNDRISSGLGIRRASDNPAGLVIAQQLRAQIGSLGQAVENTQTAANTVGTAEAALSEVSNQLVELRRLNVAALNTGGLPDEARAALQEQADNIVASIDRIAGTTRFGRQSLLNGSQSFTTAGVPSSITGLDIEAARLSSATGTSTVTGSITAAATKATATGTIAATQAVASTVRITGEKGSATINIAAGATTADVEAAINGVKDFTGVEASGGAITSGEVGSAAFVQIEEVSGDLAGITAGRTTGTDIVGTVNGVATTGNRNTLVAQGGAFSGEIAFSPTVAPGAFSFTITGGGAQLQLGSEATGADQLRIGLPSLFTSTLGGSSTIGALSSVTTGGKNSLLADPGAGLRVVDAALSEVNGLRGRLGAVVSQTFEPNVRSLNVALENLIASRSSIEDADIAEQVARQVRDNVLTQAGIGVLRNQNLQAGSVLRLLQ